MEHPADHVPLALLALPTDYSTVVPRQLHRPVGGIVVIDIDHGLRQRRLYIVHHLGYGLLLIITGNQYCYFFHLTLPFLPLNRHRGYCGACRHTLRHPRFFVPCSAPAPSIVCPAAQHIREICHAADHMAQIRHPLQQNRRASLPAHPKAPDASSRLPLFPAGPSDQLRTVVRTSIRREANWQKKIP